MRHENKFIKVNKVKETKFAHNITQKQTLKSSTKSIL